MKKGVLIVFIILLIGNIIKAQEVKHFLYYSKVYDLEANNNKVFCATDKGILVYDKRDDQFINYAERDESLVGEKVYAIVTNENTGAVLSFTNKGVYELITGKYWDRIHDSIGRIKSHFAEKETLYVKNEKNKVYEYSYKDFELKRRNEVVGNFKSIHEKIGKNIFPRNSFNISNSIEVIESKKIDSRKFLIFTRRGYLLIYDNMRKNYIINHGSVFDNKIVDIFESDSKLFFLGDKVNILEDDRYKFINLVELKNNINDITNYGMDSILIASKSNGVYKWSDNNLENKYMTKDGLLSNNIYQIESNGRYIFAVSKYGVSVIDERLQTVKNLKGIDYYNILNMEVYKDLLILQKKDGLVIKNLNKEKKLTISATDLLNDILTDIIIVDKRVYISGNQGITSYNLENNNIENVVNFHYKINDILYYNDLIYIGSDSGLYYYNLKEGEISEFRENDELSSKKILKIINLDECVFIKTEDSIDVIL